MTKLFIPNRIYSVLLIYGLVVLSGTIYAVAKEYKNSDGIVFSNGHPIVGDFICFYAVGKLAQADFRSLYNAARHEEIMNDVLKPHRVPGLLMFFYPPLVALIFMPFALLPLIHAYLAWTLASLLVFSLSVVMILRAFNIGKRAGFLLYLLALAYVPFMSDCMIAGQTSAISFFVFTLIFLCLKSRKEISAGLFLGAGFYYKPTLFVIFFILMILRKKRTVIRSSFFFLLAMGVISMTVVGLHESLHYLRMSLDNLMHGKLGGEMGSEVLLTKGANLRALLELNFKTHHFLANGIYAFVSSGALMFYTYCDRSRRIEKSNEAEFSDYTSATDIGLSVLLAPYLLVYDLTILVLPMLIVTARSLGKEAQSNRANFMLMVTFCLYIASVFPTYAKGPVVILGYPVALCIWLAAVQRRLK